MENLTISQNVAKVLASLSTLLLEGDGEERLKNMCKYILQIVTVGKATAVIESADEEALSAISIVIFEAAKAQASTEQLKSTLIELAVSTEAVEMISALYDRHRGSFIQRLSLIGITFPMVIGVEWRLDNVVRSKYGGRENYPLFLISLKVKDRGLVRFIDFTATHEELEDLVSKVRDGVKQVDRILNTKVFK